MVKKVLTKCKKSDINLNKQIPRYVTKILQMHKLKNQEGEE